MIIANTRIIPSSNIADFAWSSLRRFHNVSYIKDSICQLHSVPKEQHKNAQKQATQIRYCLMQAKEYFDAAQAVTLATKPTLLYYSIMHLALAEILFKQSGKSSLDKARAEHKHHGLLFAFSGFSKTDKSLKAAAQALRATPSVDGAGNLYGTFELWHKSCREMPVVGEINTKFGTGIGHIVQNVIFGAIDQRLALVPKRGMSLYECLAALPGMYEFVRTHGIDSIIIRGRVDMETRMRDPKPPTHLTQIVIHPAAPQLITEYMENFKFSADAVNSSLNYKDSASSGGIISWKEDLDTQFKNMPHGSMWKQNEVRFWPRNMPLNEFGFLYMALFIVGNYARYYPDFWMDDVESCTPLALAIEELVKMAEMRMPLLTLSEMARVYHVPEE
jgi:hypothetical protein